MPTQDVLERARHKEDLLHQPELLTAFGAVVRVEDLGDCFTGIAITDGLDIAATVKGTEVELGRRLGFPKAEEVNAARREAGNRDIPGHTDEVARIDEFSAMVTTVIDILLDTAVERNADAEVRATDEPWVIIRQPSVRDLDLAALHERLAE